MFRLILIFFVFITLSCTKDENVNINSNTNLYIDNTLNDEELFKKANDYIRYSQYDLALIELDKLDVLFPNSELNKKGLLTSAYIHFLKKDYEKCRAIAENFKKYYPGSNNIDYANYLDAMTYFILLKKTNYSQQNSFTALEKFEFILNAYPNSKYEIDIITKIQIIKNNIADHKLNTAKYYIDKKNKEASLIYLKDIYKNYRNSIYIAETLYLLTKIYYSMDEKEIAKEYAAILAYNFPESFWYEKSYNILNNLEINEIEQKWYEKFNPIKILARDKEKNYNNTSIKSLE